MDKTRNVRRTLGVLLLGVSLSAAACTSTDPDADASAPVVQAFPAEGFTAEFPTAPTREEDKAAAAGVDITLITYRVGDLVVGYVNYPTTLVASLDAAVKGAADNIKGTIQSRSDTTFMGHPATDVVIKAPDGVVHTRMVLRGQRLYSLVGAGKSGPPASYARLVETFVLN